MTYLDNVVEFHVNIIFPSICIEKLCITIFFIDENVRLLLFQRIRPFYFFFCSTVDYINDGRIHLKSQEHHFSGRGPVNGLRSESNAVSFNALKAQCKTFTVMKN